ncbi:hypothetical protein ACI7RC_00805 [Brevibacillus sp. B_LB10_24]|uniref:hypothetical protein n=1 Tax=Brevibacillus sp. B_LB10_24 TaxID=3380645 RepID=UPI0038BC7DC9
MQQRTILITSILAFGLLSACDKESQAVQVPGQEALHSQASAAGQTGSHGGHSGRGGGRQSAGDNFKASFTFANGGATANQTAEMTIQITDKAGKPVRDFEVNHEKLLHLIIVNHDQSFFRHIHPEYRGNGKFTVVTSFPAGGKYKVFADFTPAGGAGTTQSQWIQVEGKEGEHTPITADPKLVKEADGKEIELSLSSTKASDDVTLTYSFRDARTKRGIDDLEPYLGAVGHVVILSADAEQYLHVHPQNEQTTGPLAQFMTAFPRSGTYKIWGQFQHRGEVITVPFVVDVK